MESYKEIVLIKPVLLSGGKGSRLWPLSRELYPKQYLKVNGAQSLLQQTLTRLDDLGDMLPPVIICNSEHRFLVAEQLREIEVQSDIVLEPIGRDTAPAIAVAALLSEEEDPLLLVMPADHVIRDTGALLAAVRKAESLARAGYLVTFGISPDRPETGYGYLLASEPVQEGFRIERFVEKPDLDTAQQYLDHGGFYWNSGMFLMHASTLLRELGTYAPDMLDSCRQTVEKSYDDLGFRRLDGETFSDCPAESFDYAVMEKTSHCAMVPLAAGWSDLGSWASMFQIAEKDDLENVCIGDVMAHDSRGCYLRADKRLLAAVGLDDIIAVETSDAVLVAHKDKVQHVKGIVKQLKAEKRPEAENHNKIYRPWGSFERIAQKDRFQVKRIEVKPGQVLSLQKHHHRAEHWVVVRGTAKVTIGDQESLMTEDQSVYIPIGQVHRLENPGKIPLEIIEIQTGAYLGEDDIVRFEDLYGRES